MPETERRAIGQNARTRVLAEHTAAHRSAQLEQYVLELIVWKVKQIEVRSLYSNSLGNS